MRPEAILLDFGETLLQEVRYEPWVGNAWLFDRAAYCPPSVTLPHVLERANRVNREVAALRHQLQFETPWPTLTRLIYDFLGVRFAEPMADLEMGFWKASVDMRPMEGVRSALDEFHACGIPYAVLSNCAFGPRVVEHELSRHGLADHLAFVMVSAEYSVRKANVLFFDTAAARLGVEPKDIWFVGDRIDADIVGAKAAGMTAVWLRQSHDELEAAAVSASSGEVVSQVSENGQLRKPDIVAYGKRLA